MTTTVKDIEGAFARMVHAAGHAGIAGTSRWTLQHGSQTYGRAWRVYQVGDEFGEGTGYHDVLGNDGYVGWTRQDAYTTLCGMARVLQLQVRSVSA